jgi:transcriptional regulator with XRE-family HTH domain
MEGKVTIGKRIADLRKQKGMTQEQLANQVGVTAQAVSKWENDLSCPDISALPQLAEVLGVTTDELLGKVQLRSLTVEDSEKSEKHKHTVNVRLNMNKWEKVIFALLVMGLGIVFLLNAFHVIQLGSGITFWSVLWPFCLFFMGVMLCKSDLSPMSLGIALFGLYMLLYNFGIIPAQYKLTWSMIWPAALILIGLTVLLGYLFPKRKENNEGFFHVEKGDPVFECEEEGGFFEGVGSVCDHNSRDGIFGEFFVDKMS